jgi:hypothetical protein
VSLIVPIFRDSGFDAEATGALGKAYDIACRALHPKGQPPVVQEILAKKIIEVAQRGERDPTGWRPSLWPTWARFTAK